MYLRFARKNDRRSRHVWVQCASYERDPSGVHRMTGCVGSEDGLKSVGREYELVAVKEHNEMGLK